jgi:hypothetical protein
MMKRRLLVFKFAVIAMAAMLTVAEANAANQFNDTGEAAAVVNQVDQGIPNAVDTQAANQFNDTGEAAAINAVAANNQGAPAPIA